MVNEMTLSSRHRVRNSSPGGLRQSTLPLDIPPLYDAVCRDYMPCGEPILTVGRTESLIMESRQPHRRGQSRCKPSWVSTIVKKKPGWTGGWPGWCETTEEGCRNNDNTQHRHDHIDNADRICHTPNTPTTRVRSEEIIRIDQLCKQNLQNYIQNICQKKPAQHHVK